LKILSIFHRILIVCLHRRGIILSFRLVRFGTVLLRGYLLGDRTVHVHLGLRRGQLRLRTPCLFVTVDRIWSGIILCFDNLTLRLFAGFLLAGLLLYHTLPKFPNLINCGITLAKE
jgi:hypothetical protein